MFPWMNRSFSKPRNRGAESETRALNHLRRQGLQPLDRNYRSRRGEIDLIMLDRAREGETLVFVEVRYRERDGYGGALESIDIHKQRRLAAAAAAYLQEHPQRAERPCRFDVVADEGGELHWIRDAFRI